MTGLQQDTKCVQFSLITFAVMCISVGKQMLLIYVAHLEHSTDHEVEKESLFTVHVKYSACTLFLTY